MYTAQIESKTFSKGILQIGVIYFSDSDKFTEVYTIGNVEDIDAIIVSRLAQLNSIDISKVSLGVFTPPAQNIKEVSISVDQTESDQGTFSLDLTLFKQMQRAVSLGLKTEGDKDFVELQSKLKNEFLPDYLSLL